MLRRSNENEQDIISNLIDCILIHILSFLNAKEAVQTCILSKRWINLWKCLPTLTLSSANISKKFNLPVLTNLSLQYIALHRGDDGCVDPFLTFNMLNCLIIDSCIVQDALCSKSSNLCFYWSLYTKTFWKQECSLLYQTCRYPCNVLLELEGRADFIGSTQLVG